MVNSIHIVITLAVWTLLPHLPKKPFAAAVGSSPTLNNVLAALACRPKALDRMTVVILNVVFFDFALNSHDKPVA